MCADEFVKLKAIDHIAHLLIPKNDFDVRLEATLSTLNIFTENVEAASRCRESELNLQNKLQEIVKTLQNKPACQVKESGGFVLIVFFLQYCVFFLLGNHRIQPEFTI